MKIENLLVGNGGGIENGLLHVQGGGWETYAVQFYPATLQGVLAGIAVLDDDELGELPALSFRIYDTAGALGGATGSSIVNGARPRAPEGVPTRIPFMVMFTTVANAATLARIELSSSGAVIAATTFAVVDAIPDAPTGD